MPSADQEFSIHQTPSDCGRGVHQQRAAVRLMTRGGMRVDPSSALACDAYTDANALTLALLPTDLLRHILVQRGIGPRELCTLECTAWLFRQLADDDAWRHRVKPSAQTPTVK